MKKYSLTKPSKKLLILINEYRHAMQNDYLPDFRTRYQLPDEEKEIARSLRRALHMKVKTADQLFPETAIKFALGWIWDVAIAETKNGKLKQINAMKDALSIYVYEMKTTLNGNFNLVPAERIQAFKLIRQSDGSYVPLLETAKQKKLALTAEWIFARAVILGREITGSPHRLKLCPYCQVIFWDAETKSGNRRICGKSRCSKLWGAERVRQSRKTKINRSQREEMKSRPLKTRKK
jgi:hypothetical protein